MLLMKGGECNVTCQSRRVKMLIDVYGGSGGFMNLQLRDRHSFDNKRSDLWKFIRDENGAVEGHLSALDELLEKLHWVLGVHWWMEMRK